MMGMIDKNSTEVIEEALKELDMISLWNWKLLIFSKESEKI